MQLSFYGANREVTGSRHVLDVNRKRILMDCGLYQGKRSEAADKNKNFGFDPRSVDAVVLSHAHIDHSGNLPNLVKQGFNGPIYCTSATVDLLEYMLRDSAAIQEREIEYMNRKRMERGEELLTPLYTMDDAEATLKLIKGVPYGECFELGEGIQVCFQEAGHILGSAVSIFTIVDQADSKTKRFVYTGDLGRKNTALIRNPYEVPEADYLMIESTYGNRLHASLLEAADELASVVNRTAARGGKILIPAFSLGRTQEIVYTLHQLRDAHKIPENIPIYVDSPLSVNVTQVFKKNTKELNDKVKEAFINNGEDPLGFASLKYIEKVEESKALNQHKGPCIIISASGMMEHGRILHHLKNSIEDHRNTVLVVGFQAKNTLGRYLVEKAPSVKIFGKLYDVKIEIKTMNAYSAHADRSDLLDYITKIKGLKKVILVHGEDTAIEDFKGALNENGVSDVFIPSFGDHLEL